MHNAWITAGGEKMSKSMGNGMEVSRVLERFRGIELRYYLVSSHYRSHVEFSFEALDEAARSFRRIERFLELRGAEGPGPIPDAFAAAMDDDLSTPAAMAVLHETVRAGNRAADPSPHLAATRAMLAVLGLDPVESTWPTGGGVEGRLSTVVDALVQDLLADRARAREERDWARADAIRDRLATAGITVEDGVRGTKWALRAPDADRHHP